MKLSQELSFSCKTNFFVIYFLYEKHIKIKIGGIKLNKKNLIIVILVLIIIVGLLLFVINNGNDEDTKIENSNKSEIEIKIEESIMDEDEKEVSKKKKQELYEFIPKVYTEAVAPFDSYFILDAVMDKITSEEETPDYSVEKVDNYVKEIFGEESSINKEDVSEPDIKKSIYYYSKEAESYAVIPIGYQGIYEKQIFKTATETEDYYYVYTYVLQGGFAYDETTATENEFGTLDYTNSKVQVIVGDKEGNDLEHIFDTDKTMYDDEIWLNNYLDKMPIFKYTLKKDNGTYYLTDVEQVNY